MTTRGRGSVRIGPISLFALVIILCLAVMAVLSVTTAQATYAAAERQAEALSAVRAALPEGAELDGSTVKAEFTADSGRTLAVVLEIRADATYSVASWKATTLWTENGAGETLWSGAAQTR